MTVLKQKFWQAAIAACLLFLSGATSAYTQAPDTIWTRHINNIYGDSPEAVATDDGGYVIVSYIWMGEERDDNDMAMMKVDSSGEVLWSHSYSPLLRGDSVYWSEEAQTVQQTADGGFVVAGGGAYGLVVKTDSEGNAEWMHQYAVEDGEFRIARGSALSADGNLLVIETRQIFLLDMSNEGEILWQHDFRRIRSGSFFDVTNTDDGGYLLAGVTGAIGAGSGDFYAVRVDENGREIWAEAYGTAEYELCSGVAAMSDGGFCLVGMSQFGIQDSTDAFIVRIDGDGHELWRLVVLTEIHDNRLNEVIETRDGGVIAVGDRDVPRNLLDGLVIRTNREGAILWSATYNGGNFDMVYNVFLLNDNSLLLTGESQHTWLVRTTPDPETLPMEFSADTQHNFDSVNVDSTAIWEVAFYNTGQRNVKMDSVSLSGDTTVFASDVELPLLIERGDSAFVPIGFRPLVDTVYAATLTFWYNDTSFDVSLTGRGIDPDGVSDDAFRPLTFELSAPYPNPFNSTTLLNFTIPTTSRVRLAAYDLGGHELAVISNAFYPAGNNSLVWNGSNLPAGVFFIRIEAGIDVETAKVVLLR